MEHVKILGFAAVAAMALMAFAAGSASATALYNGGTKLEFGAELDFSLKGGTPANLVETSAPNGEGKTLDSCKSSTVKGKISNEGGVGIPVEGSISDEIKEGKTVVTGLTWSSCTFPTTTTIPGGLKVERIDETTKGTVKANAEIGVTINTVFFGSCVYGVENGTHLGTLTTAESGTAEFHANAVAKKLSGSNIACPSTSVWTATYVSTTPDNLRVEGS